MKITSALLVSLAATASAAPHPVTIGNPVVHEKRDLGSNSRWVKRDALDADTRLPVRIALKQRNLDKGMDYLLEV
jgi:tripeptidyl-peptidase-1